MPIMTLPFELPDVHQTTVCQNKYFKLKIVTRISKVDNQGGKRSNVFQWNNERSGQFSLGTILDTFFQLSTDKTYVIFGPGQQRFLSEKLLEAEGWLRNSTETFMEQVDHSWKILKGHQTICLMTENKRLIIAAAVMTYPDGITEQGISIKIADPVTILDEIFLNGTKFAEFIQVISTTSLQQFGMGQLAMINLYK